MTRQERRRQAVGKVEPETVGVVAGAIGGGSMLAIAGLVAALAERGVIEPSKVADWIDMLARGFGADQEPAIRDGVKVQCAGLVQMLRAMATLPQGAGRA